MKDTNMTEFNKRLDEFSERVLSKALTPDEETNYTESLFDSIRHINEYGQEFWYARELQNALEYTEWRNFIKVIEKAKKASFNSDINLSDHFVDITKMVNIDSGAERELVGAAINRRPFTSSRIPSDTRQFQ